MNIYYWSPFLSKVATVDAVINSAISLLKYGKEQYVPHIINCVGEWDDYVEILKKNKIKLIKLENNTKGFYNNLPRYSFVKSRISYYLIIFKVFKKAHIFFKSLNKSDVVILHLLVSYPMLLNFFFNYKCKFILRISGLPNFNIFRKIIWKICGTKISFVTTPTEGTLNDLREKKIFDTSKVSLVRDPIVNINDVRRKIINKCNLDFIYCLSIGRLSKQKNFSFLIKNFNQIAKIYQDIHLVIIGEGEEKKNLLNLIQKEKLIDRIHLIGFQKNIYKYLKNSEFFILSSLWEDPGFVLLEAASSRIPIISSDCRNGPKEILQNGNAGYLYKSNDPDSFLNTFKSFYLDKKEVNQKKLLKKKIKAFKKSKYYSKIYHYNAIKRLLT
jgi:glycosyltransferase involved in cell wall biosynthesis